MGLFGILLGLALLVWLAYRGWSILLLAPAAALIAAAFAGGPLLAYWTQTFMDSGSRFIAQFFPLFLLGALFGKLMEDSGSVSAIARYMTERLGPARAIVTVVLAGAIVTYGGVSLFVAFFVLAPMAQELFRTAALPNRLIPAAITLGTSTFTMSALPGTPAIQNAIPMPCLGTTPLAAPGLGIIASAIMIAFGLWWLRRAATAARGSSPAYGRLQAVTIERVVEDETVRQRATTVANLIPPKSAAVSRAHSAAHPLGRSAAPRRSECQRADDTGILPRLDVSFLAEERFGATSLAAVGGVWSVVTALLAAIVTVIAANRDRPPALRETMDAGANASVLPVLSVASLVGFGAVVTAVPAFDIVRNWMLSIEGGPLVSLAIATNLLSALTGSASGGMTIALDALGSTYMRLAAAHASIRRCCIGSR